MGERRRRKPSLRVPVILLVTVLVLIVTLTVLWNVVLAHDYATLKELAIGTSFHTAFIVLGSALFLAIIVLSTILGIRLISNLRWSQRQTDFLASVSHELNSPLSSIKLFAQTLRRPGLSDEDRAGFAAKILVDTDRLSRIIANIVRAAEVDHRGEDISVAPVEVDLRPYLEEYVEVAHTVYAGEVELTLEGDDACVEIDPLMFRQVLDNLIDNAGRYRRTKPARVVLRIVAAGPWVALEVADDGIGMPKDVVDHVFERFYRIDRGGPAAGPRGMGIGLSVVRAIVRSHGGMVTAHSDGPDRGATIRIRLPAVEQTPVTA